MKIGRLTIKRSRVVGFDLLPWRSVAYEDGRRMYWARFIFTWTYHEGRKSVFGSLWGKSS
jgi:hypothetical protein